MKKSNQTVSRNFRFNGEAALSLEFESQRKGISLNSLVNNIFRKYSDFDRLAERTDMVTLNRYLLSLLLESIPEDTLAERVFEFGKQSGHDNLLFWKKEVSVDTLRDYITNILCEYCNLAEYDVKANTDTFVLTHELGPHGTVFLKSYIAGFIAGCLRETVPVEAAGSTIKFSLDHQTPRKA
ncbi:MAG: hypothetical protein OK455_03530 [Thaumarchaeota archaeon]|nr:hypothetical protein [Nitrososphaerota archaeon]